MKKIIMLMIGSMLLLSGCGSAETVSQPSVSESMVERSEESSDEETDKMLESMHLAEEKKKELTESEKYRNAEKEKKIEMALQFFEGLKNDGLIEHYDYFEGNEMISYTYLNGALGGISFRDFSEKIDGLAMN